jgi:hypothetical protein
LIDPVTLQWDEQLVQNNFWDVDAKVILATPIREEFEDYYAWQYDQKGQFSVKIRDGPQALSSNDSDSVQFWRAIWKLPCLPKIQQFVWRLAHNSLPLMIRIKSRGMDCDTKCVCCRRLDEDGAHLFFKCKEIKREWERMEMETIRARMSL